uniref:Uncharacterized protein n=1 Tax=Oryza glumipatula TaxID=40148 RepID=A0A0E0A2Q3_9ORYZ
MQQRRSTARWLEQRRMHSPAHCIDDNGNQTLVMHPSSDHLTRCRASSRLHAARHRIVPLQTPWWFPLPPEPYPGLPLHRRSHATQFLTFNEWMTSDNNMDLRLGGPVQKV